MILAMIFSIAIPASAQTTDEIVQSITENAIKYEVDTDLAVAVATIESSLNPKAKGNLGEIGLFQLRPEYHKGHLANTKVNIQTGIKYLKQVKKMCEARFKEAWVVCYNAGPHTKIKYPKKTTYYKKIVTELNRIKFNRYLASAN